MSTPPADPNALLRRALGEVRDARARLEAAERAKREPIAVVGLGCRMPGGAADPDAVWALLQGDQDLIREPPPGRWDVAAWSRDLPARGGPAFPAGYLDDISAFAARFFSISPREAAGMDPQHRLLLEVAWEALEDAGQAPDRLAESRTGVWVGQSNEDFNHLPFEAAGGLERVSGAARSFAAGRIAYALGLRGPAVVLDTACSSSLVAVHQALHSLRAGETDLALAGGVNLILSPLGHRILGEARMLAPDGRCKAFDAAADGYVRGEGAVLFALRRLSDALADGDRIYATLLGSAVNHDGASSGLTVPSGAAQAALIREALRRAGRQPDEVDLVETHGTGTALGDPIEARALGAVFAGRPRPLHLGALKSRVGHLESAAGAAGLLKVVLGLWKGSFPSNLHNQEPTPLVPWAELPLSLPASPFAWTGPARVAGVSSFGASGTNAHVVVGAAPEPAQPTGRALPLCLLTLSARNEAELRAVAGGLEGRLAAGADPDALAWSWNSGRARHRFRAAVQGAGAEALRAGLARIAAAEEAPSQAAPQPGLALLFTGQGAQRGGMGLGLAAAVPAFAEELDRVAALLAPLLDRPLRGLLADEEALARTEYAQPAICALQIALAATLERWGLPGRAVLGHSVGELAAAVVAGCYSAEQGLALAVARGQAMERAGAEGEMIAVFGALERVEALLEEAGDSLGLAAINGPEEVVLSGRAPAVAEAAARAERAGLRVRSLRSRYAFHGPPVAPALPAIRAAASALESRAPRLIFASNLDGQARGTPLDADYWAAQALSPVRFSDGLGALRRAGMRVFLELGPRPVLCALGRRAAPEAAWLPTLRAEQDEAGALLAALGALHEQGVDADWRAIYGAARPPRLTLPAYPFSRQRFDWPQPTPERAATLHSRSSSLDTNKSPFQASEVDSPALDARAVAFTLRLEDSALLRDHRILGAPVVSGAVMLVLVGQAIGALPSPLRPRYADLVFRAPMVLREGEALAVQVVLRAEDGGAARFALHSRGPEGWTLHAAGRYRLAAPPSVEEVADLAAIQARCALDPDPYGASWRAEVHQLGDSLRAMTALWRRDGEALAALRVPALPGEQDGPALRAARVGEASGQALKAALPDRGEGEGWTLLGQAVDESWDAGLPEGPLYWHARLDAADPQGCVGEVRLLDGAGRVIGRTAGLRLGRVDLATLQRGLRGGGRRRIAAPDPGLLARSDGPARRRILLDYLRAGLAAISGARPDDLAEQDSLRALGLDSLMCLDLREAIQQDLGISLPLATLLGDPSLGALCTALGAPAGPSVPAPRDEGLLRWLHHGADPRLRVLALPYGGAGASLFRPWAAALGRGRLGAALELLAVQLPGREDRLEEAPFTAWEPLLDALERAVTPLLDRPLALLGASLGALIGAALARRLQRIDAGQPARLIALAAPAPDRPEWSSPPAFAPLPEALEQALGPAMRADAALALAWRETPGPPLHLPVLALGGRQDAQVSVEALAGWSRLSRGSFDLKLFDGDHLIARDPPASLLAEVEAFLQVEPSAT